MVSRVQRLGGGPCAVAAARWRAWSPGPWCKRSCSCCLRCRSRLKAPPAVAAVAVGEQAREPFVLVVVEPGVDGVGVAGAEQAGVGHGVRGLPVRDLEDRGTALADVGLGVVVAVVEQGGALVVRERQGTALVHRQTPLWFRYTIIRPYRTWSSKLIRGIALAEKNRPFFPVLSADQHSTRGKEEGAPLLQPLVSPLGWHPMSLGTPNAAAAATRRGRGSSEARQALEAVPDPPKRRATRGRWAGP